MWLGVACLGMSGISPLFGQQDKLRATLKGHTDAVRSVAFGGDSELLASGSQDRTVKLWVIPVTKKANK